MSEILLETAAFRLERETLGYVAVKDPRWTITLKTPDGSAVITKAGMVRLFEVIAHERSLIVP